MEDFLLGDRGDWPLGTGVAEEKRGRESERHRRWAGLPFKRECSECAQVVFSAAIAEDIYSKVKLVQMPKY